MCALFPQLHELAEQDRLLAALSDRRARVAHAACTVLAHDHVVPRERLWTLLATASRAHTRNCVVRLLARGERIDSMTWLLNAAAFADKAVRAQACTHLVRWGSGWPKVPPQRLAAFRVALTWHFGLRLKRLPVSAPSLRSGQTCRRRRISNASLQGR